MLEDAPELRALARGTNNTILELTNETRED